MLSRKFKIERKDFPKDLRVGRGFIHPTSRFLYLNLQETNQAGSLLLFQQRFQKSHHKKSLKKKGYDVIKGLPRRAGLPVRFYFKKGSDKISFSETKRNNFSA